MQTSYDALRNATNYGYDDASRRTTITDAVQKTTTFGYDNVGNQTSVLDSNHNLTGYVYDRLGRKTQTTYPDQSSDTTHYDSLGRVDYKIDQAGQRTDHGYDGDGRLTSVTQYLNPGQPNQQTLVTSYGYDEVGNRVSQTDANGHTTKYEYDQLGRRTKRTLPAGQVETYSYDAVGNLQSKTDFNGKSTNYVYDANNRLKSKTPDASFHAPAVTFTYSATGKRLTMSDVSGVTTYAYDPQMDRLVQKQTPEGILNYTYDAAGNLKSLQSQNQNGGSDAYTYDADNRLSTVTDASGQTTYGYDAVGNLQGYTYPNGVAATYGYNTLNRLTQMGSSAKGTPISSYVYTLGPAGNRLSVAELSGRTVSYGYDSLYRLTSEAISHDPAGKNGTTQYAYDAVGNRQQLIVNGVTANTYAYDADDRLGSDQYDANGNTTLSTGTSNVYDFENHLIQHGNVTVVYDGDGNRVAETVGGVTTKYLVDTQNPTGYAQVVDELQNGAVTRTYSYGLERISEKQSSGTSFYGYDGHGSVRQLTNAAGVVTDSYDYDAFGNLINSSGSTPNNYLFAGEQFDPALGLYYNRARYLNTTTDRFTSADPLEGDDTTPISLHRYVYAEANPVSFTDPSGNVSLGETTAVQADSETIDEAEDEADRPALQALTNFIARTGPVIVQGVKAGITLTIAGAILLGSVAPLFTGSPAEDLLLQNGHNTDDDQKALFAFGNKTAPRAPRIGTDIHPDDNGMVGPTDPPEGASAFANVLKSGLTGWFHGIRLGDVWATDGLSAIADGSNVKTGSSNPPTHYTIFPTRRMSAQEFITKFLNLPWQLAGSQ